LLSLVAAGCASRGRGASVTCSPPECPADTTLQLVAEVDPPSESQLARQEFASVMLDPQTGQFVLALSAPVTLRGTVHLNAGDLAKTVPATVVATRPSRIAGRPDVFYQSAVNPMTGEYVLIVSRNIGDEKYAVRVTTTDPSLVPPKQLMVSADHDQTVDLTFEDPLKLPELHGTIRDSLQTPVAGMQVQAIDPATSQVVSTTTTTDLNGAFSVRLVAAPPATVRLTATPTTGAMSLLPLLQLDVATSKLGVTNSLTCDMSVPPLPAAAHVIYKVLGVGTSGAEMPVAAASCVFAAEVTDPHATDGTKAYYRTTATTDALGQVAVDLIPVDSGNRTYAVTVAPGASSLFAATETTVVVAPQGGYAQPLMLALRPQLSGQVFDPQSSPLRGLMVVPAAGTVAASAGLTPFVAPTSPPQTTADADGRFAVRLDRGFWDIGLIPPADSMLPRLWLSQVQLDADYDVGTIFLPRGVMVHGVVNDATGVALAKANVRLYTVAPGNASCAGDMRDQCLAPPRLRAEGSSGANGVVALILPSQPD
jgi:hypothetical protein